MDREELAKMKLEALRLLAAERGVDGARNLGKADLIERLAPKTMVERAKEAVAHAVEVVEEKAHELADKMKHHRKEPAGGLEPAVVSAEPRKPADAIVEKKAHPSNGFGVPSATVHPHVDTGPQEPTGMLDFEELPETYGVDECEVLFKDPFWVFAYWEVTDGGISSARAQLGPSAQSSRLVMRLFTTVPGPEGVDRADPRRRPAVEPRPPLHAVAEAGRAPARRRGPAVAAKATSRPSPTRRWCGCRPPSAQPGPVEWMEVIPPRSARPPARAARDRAARRRPRRARRQDARRRRRRRVARHLAVGGPPRIPLRRQLVAPRRQARGELMAVGRSGAGAARAPAVHSSSRASLPPRGELALRGHHRHLPAAARCLPRPGARRRALPHDASRCRRRLCTMLRDDLLKTRYRAVPRSPAPPRRRRAAPHRSNDPTFHRIARFYADRFGRLKALYDELRGDLVGAFRALQDDGFLEIITVGATHGYLPVIREPQARRAQIQVACESYQQHVRPLAARHLAARVRLHRGRRGAAGRGGAALLLRRRARHPQRQAAAAARHPRAGVLHPIGRRRLRPRPRVVEAGVERQGGLSRRRRLPRLLPRHRLRSAARLHRPATSTPTASASTPASSTSASPASNVDLAHKQPYDPDVAARERAAEHAGNFMFNREKQIEHLSAHMDRRPLVVSPYDAELYGHWWFEGPWFLDFLARKIAFDQSTVRLGTCAEYLEDNTVNAVAEPSPSSWGDGGYSGVWVDGSNDWIYRHVHRAEARMHELARRWQGRHRRHHAARAQPGGARACSWRSRAIGRSS